MTRDQVYIANVIKCRPPGNRNPEPDEVAACEPFLFRQIDVIQPKVIVPLGKFAKLSLAWLGGSVDNYVTDNGNVAKQNIDLRLDTINKNLLWMGDEVAKQERKVTEAETAMASYREQQNAL